MNQTEITELDNCVSAGCHINDVMNNSTKTNGNIMVSAGCHINDVMNRV